MTEIQCDVAIIGGGTAGLAAERSARRHGARTILIDESFSGTTCTNVGCMPSKLLIAAAAAAHAVRQASIFGIEASPDVDGVAVMKRVRVERDRFIADVLKSIEKIPADIRRKGRAKFLSADTLELEDGTIVRAGAIVIATGARPSIPDFLSGVKDRVLTNESLFDLPDLPRSVGVVGAGPLGLELAQALGRLGVEVVVFDEGRKLASLEDKAVAESLDAILREELPIHLGVKLGAERSEGGVAISWTGDSEGNARFDYVLATAGRPPRLDGLALEKTGLALDKHGAPEVDPETLQCGDAAIFMAGDADHARPVLHEAQAEGAIAGRNAAAFPSVTPSRRMVPLSIMFTDPAMAVIGKIPEDGDGAMVCGTASYETQGRAKVCATNKGLANIYASKGDGKLVGAALVAPGGEHLAHFLAGAIQTGRTASELLDLPFYHPTYEEGLQPALRAICKAVHSPVPANRDDGFMPGA